MRIDLLLDPAMDDFGPFQRDLSEELSELASTEVRLTQERMPPPSGTLAVDEVYRFLLEHREQLRTGAAALAFLKVLFEIIRAVISRRSKPEDKKAATPKKKTKPKKKPAPPKVVVVVDGNRLDLPCSAAKQRAFLEKVTSASQEVSPATGRKK